MGNLIYYTVVFTTIAVGNIAPIAAAVAPDSSTVVWAVAGQQANLPCRPAVKMPGDQPVLVLWYRTSHTLPIYSYDARNSDFSSGVRWTDNKTFEGRAYFDGRISPPALILNPAHARDEGQYMCRIDYRTSSSTNSLVSLNIIISPGPAMIFWKGREIDQGSVGPLQEDQRVRLTCRTAGGKPSPTIIWSVGSDEIAPTDTRFNVDAATGTYTVESTISVRAERSMVGHHLTCSAYTSIKNQVRNTPDKPVVRSRSATVSLDITLPPTNVQIFGSESLVVTAGSEIKMACRAYGSFPPARITWWKDDIPLEPFVSYRVGPDGNATATLRMNVSADDDRGRLSCQAQNSHLSSEPLYDVTQLIVYYPPKVTLSLGPHLQAEDIKEGDDVYFECDIKANPSFNRVEWYHNGAPLTHNPVQGMVIIRLSLVLRGLQRSSSGSYTCVATNLQGRTTSNAVYLTVRHAPMCAGSTQERTQGATRGSEATVKCTVEAEPASGLSWSWVKIREDANEEEALSGLITNNDLTSAVSFVPRTQDDYGRILCRATNAVGTQKKACVINLVPAGPPDPPYNCSATPMEIEVSGKVTSEPTPEVSLSVTCMEGFDGGLPQEFLMVGFQETEVIVNSSSEFPEWVIRGMDHDMTVTLLITAHNARGSSSVLSLEAHTSVAQQRAATGQDEADPNIAPLLGALIGGLSILLILLVTAILMAKREKPRNRKPSTEMTFTTGTPEGFDPDVVQFIQRTPHSLDVVPCLKGSHRRHRQRNAKDSPSLDLEPCTTDKGCNKCSGTAGLNDQQSYSKGLSNSQLPDNFVCPCRGQTNLRHRESNGGDQQVTGSRAANLEDPQGDSEDEKTGLCKNNLITSNESRCCSSTCPLSQQSHATSSFVPNYRETYRSQPPEPYQSYPKEPFASSVEEVPQMTTMFCSQCQSLPRPGSEIQYHHQQSLRDLRSLMRGNPRRLSSSASLGQLKNLSLSQKELFYSSTKDFQVHLVSSENQRSATLRPSRGSQNTLPTPRQKQVLDSAIDINLALPDEMGSIMVMKLLREKNPQWALPRRTLSETECPEICQKGKVCLHSFGKCDVNGKHGCVSVHESCTCQVTEEKCIPSKGCYEGNINTDHSETNLEYVPLNSEHDDSKHYVKVSLENQNYSLSKEKIPPSYDVICQKDHEIISQRPNFPYKKLPQESSV